jgi:transcriptional regulator with GAF, ATPase, and Fis domain
MGDQAVAFFNEADRIGGIVARMRLASMTQLTSTQAVSVADGPELLAKLEKAIARLRGDFESSGPVAKKTAETHRASIKAGADDVRTLRRQISGFVDLMSQRSLFLGDVNETLRRVNEAAGATLDCARVSVWFHDDKGTQITCADLFEKKSGAHSAGVVLHQKDFPSYFKAVASEVTIAAHDAHTDPRTSCFSEVYLKPLGINSMLDVPIWVDGKMVGVVCHEHVGPQRLWNSDEESFAYLMANFVALAMERARG